MNHAKRIFSAMLALAMLAAFAGVVFAAPDSSPLTTVRYGGFVLVNGCPTSTSIFVDSTVGWTATSDSAWIRFHVGGQFVRTISRTGNRQVALVISANRTNNRIRAGIITITSDCGAVIEVHVEQRGFALSNPPPWPFNRPAWEQFILRWILFGWIWM